MVEFQPSVCQVLGLPCSPRGLGVLTHVCNPSTGEVEAGGQTFKMAVSYLTSFRTLVVETPPHISVSDLQEYSQPCGL